MLSPDTATIIVVAFLIVFGIVMPILNKKLPKFISYRWSVIVVILALLIGAVLDFGELSDEVRYALVIGALVISGGYILLRTVEKALANGWLRGVRLDVRKGDASASLSSSGDSAGRDSVPGGHDDKER